MKTVQSVIKTTQFTWCKLLLFYLKHRALGCLTIALSGLWIVHLMISSICPGFWCAPTIITIVTPFIAALAWIGAISDSNDRYLAKLDETENWCRTFFQLEEDE